MPTSSLTGQSIGYHPVMGLPPQSGAGPYGKVPQVPDPTSTQLGAIQGQMPNLAALYGLTNSLNTTIANQAALPYQLNLPNYNQNIGQSSANTSALLKGQIPQDVSNQLAQLAAERGVSTGSIGSPNANAALMRALGLTSLGLQQQGEQNLTGEIARTPTGQQFNPASFLVTPEQQQEAAYLASLFAAAPNPGAGQNLNLQNLLKGLGGLGGPGSVRGGGGGGPTDPLGFSTYQTPETTYGTYAYGGGGGGLPSSAPVMAGAGGVLPGAIPGAAGGGAGRYNPGSFYAGPNVEGPGYGPSMTPPPGGSGNADYFNQFGPGTTGRPTNPNQSQGIIPWPSPGSNEWLDQFNQMWDQGLDVNPLGPDMQFPPGQEVYPLPIDEPPYGAIG